MPGTLGLRGLGVGRMSPGGSLRHSGVLPLGEGDTEVDIRSVKGVPGRGNIGCKDTRKEVQRGASRWLGPGGEAVQRPLVLR